jgi:hypothetical protein
MTKVFGGGDPTGLDGKQDPNFLELKRYSTMLSPVVKYDIEGGVQSNLDLMEPSIDLLKTKYVDNLEQQSALLNVLGRGDVTPTQAVAGSIIGVLPTLLGGILARKYVHNDQFANAATAGMAEDSVKNLGSYFNQVTEGQKLQYMAAKMQGDAAKTSLTDQMKNYQAMAMEGLKEKSAMDRAKVVAGGREKEADRLNATIASLGGQEAGGPAPTSPFSDAVGTGSPVAGGAPATFNPSEPHAIQGLGSNTPEANAEIIGATPGEPDQAGKVALQAKADIALKTRAGTEKTLLDAEGKQQDLTGGGKYLQAGNNIFVPQTATQKDREQARELALPWSNLQRALGQLKLLVGGNWSAQRMVGNTSDEIEKLTEEVRNNLYAIESWKGKRMGGSGKVSEEYLHGAIYDPSKIGVKNVLGWIGAWGDVPGATDNTLTNLNNQIDEHFQNLGYRKFVIGEKVQTPEGVGVVKGVDPKTGGIRVE